MKTFIVIAWLALSTAINAQIQSGSFHCVCPDLGRGEYTIELDGPQHFRETIPSGNLILSNLLPGDYMLVVTRLRAVKIKQMVRIDPGRRLRLTLSASGRSHSETLPDAGAVHLCTDVQRNRPQTQPAPSPQPISPAELNRIIGFVEKEAFIDNKRRMLDVSTHSYPFFTTAQVERLARLFPFDDDRLFCIKLLAHKVIDPANLPALSVVFSYSSGKNKYYDFLKTMPHQR
ncbi:MAG: DUF4476 domain-containing protein [Bacteroidales bacterium]|jgi:hypothetical protein|nr:DUF4476 domain-containing protein [Bacteroidales bacterium]